MFARYTRVANWTLSAALAVAKSRNAVAKNRTAESSSDGYEAAAVLLRQAVAEQTSWAYDEPPAWHMPMRQCLGQALLHLGRSVDLFLTSFRDMPEANAEG